VSPILRPYSARIIYMSVDYILKISTYLKWKARACTAYILTRFKISPKTSNASMNANHCLISLTNWQWLPQKKCCCAVLSKQNIVTPTFLCFYKAQPLLDMISVVISVFTLKSIPADSLESIWSWLKHGGTNCPLVYPECLVGSLMLILNLQQKETADLFPKVIRGDSISPTRWARRIEHVHLIGGRRKRFTS
jgi:hypothetical protein